MKEFIYKSPIGNILIQEKKGLLEKVVFYDEEIELEESSGVIKECVNQLTEYFKGDRQIFDLPLNIRGTDFQKNVWDVVGKISYGKTGSYMDIAQTLNNTGAIRAVGAANGKNNFHIIIPCHRVIGSDGSLTGYVGGVDKKKKLLELEGSWHTNQLELFPS
jgi:methylated-DNA-[protein]-cysteine S-methyltransferase